MELFIYIYYFNTK